MRPNHIPIDIFLNEIAFYRPSMLKIKEFLRIEGLLLEETYIDTGKAGSEYTQNVLY